jgi:hypothetical protein
MTQASIKGPGDRAMTSAEPTVCVLCRKGHVVREKRDVAFRQWSDKGYIHCRVTIPMDICDHCNASYSADPGIDKILDDAFQREYDKR